MNVSIYVRNNKYRPSNYYRIVQYSNYFKDCRVNTLLPSFLYITFYNRKKNLIIKFILRIIIYFWIITSLTIYLIRDLINPPKYIIVQKELIPKYMPVYIAFLFKKLIKRSSLIWDFDDDIITKKQASERELQILCEYSKVIVTTNTFLKNKLDKKYQEKVILMPTTDKDMFVNNIDKVNSKRIKSFEKEIRLVWIGTDSNLPNLERIIKVLDKIALKVNKDINKKLVLIVVCSVPINIYTKHLIIKNIIWTREQAKIEVHNAHIGIMPLINNEYNKGKAAFKLVQYLSAGLPVIGSDVGFNKEVINKKNGILVQDEIDLFTWTNAILSLSKSNQIWKEYSNNAIVYWKEKFNFDNNLEKWKNILK